MLAIHSSLTPSDVRRIFEDTKAPIAQKREALVEVARNPENFEGENFGVFAAVLSAQAILPKGTDPSKEALQELSGYVRSIRHIEAHQQKIFHRLKIEADQQKIQNQELLQTIESLKNERFSLTNTVQKQEELSHSKLVELSNKIIELEQDITELQETIVKLEREKTQEHLVSEGHIALLSRYLKSAKEECTNLKKERDDIAQNLTENFEIQQQLLAQAFLNEHTAKLEELQLNYEKELENRELKTEKLANETHRLKKANQGLKTKNAELRSKIEELQDVASKLLSFILSIKDYLTSMFDSLSSTFSQLINNPAVQKFHESEFYRSHIQNLPVSETNVVELEAYTALKGNLESLKMRAEELNRSFEDSRFNSQNPRIKDDLKNFISDMEFYLNCVLPIIPDTITLTKIQQFEDRISQLQTEAEKLKTVAPDNRSWLSWWWQPPTI